MLSQSFPVQAAAYEQDTQEASPTQPLQDLPTLIQALEKQKEKHGKKPHEKTAKTLENIGNAYIKQHNHQQGLAYYKKALKMYKALYQDQAHVDIAKLLSSIGRIYNNVGNPHKALLYAEESLATFKVLYSNTPHLEVAIALFHVGISCRAVSDLDHALLHLQESLKVYTELADSELSDNIADVLNQIGLIYFGRKDFQQGLVYFMRLLEVYKSRKDNKESFAQVKAIQNIGTSYLELKDFSKAILCLEEALDIYKKLFPHKFVTVDCISSIGYAYEQINDFSKSLYWYEKALEKCKPLYDFNGTSYKSGEFIEKIARIYGHMHNHSLQLSYLQKAKDMYQSMGEQKAKQRSDFSITYFFITDQNVARVQYDIGMTHDLLDDLQQSLKNFKHSSNNYKTLYKENKSMKALLVGNMSSLKMVGITYMNLGKHKLAERYYKKSLKAAHLVKDPYYRTDARHHLGRFYHAAIHSSCPARMKKKYINKAQTTFKSAVKTSSESKVD